MRKRNGCIAAFIGNALGSNRHDSNADTGGTSAGHCDVDGSRPDQVMVHHPQDGDLSIRQAGSVPSARTLSLGSQDLVRFAGYALDRGFSVVSFLLADPALEPLEGEARDGSSAEMVSILAEHGVDELEAAMRSEFDHLYVVGVNVEEPSTGLQVSLMRRGIVVTSSIQDAEELIASAWREIRLS